MKKIILTSVAFAATLGGAALAQDSGATANADLRVTEPARVLDDATSHYEPDLLAPSFRDPVTSQVQTPVEELDAANKIYVDKSTDYLVDYLTDENNRLKADITALHGAMSVMCSNMQLLGANLRVGGLLNLGLNVGSSINCAAPQIFSDDSSAQAAAKLGWMDGYYDGYHGILGDYDSFERIAGGGVRAVTPEEQAARTPIDRLSSVYSTSEYRTNYYNAYNDGYNDRRFGRAFDNGF